VPKNPEGYLTVAEIIPGSWGLLLAIETRSLKSLLLTKIKTNKGAKPARVILFWITFSFVLLINEASCNFGRQSVFLFLNKL